ncbi:unnamed protein product [Lupinus luteus]|uniref:Reverse transcriptase domain-containing protein n=1 Tax=Lupinus luteus TaxID=3873 RepID=A0AAV1W6X6_LUPLU
MSRLDRFFVNDCWLLKWGNVVQQALSRSFYDHCPILLKNDVPDWGPSPFRSNNCWFSHPGFSKFVNDEWNKFEVVGRGSYVFKEKLKILKGVLKAWNKEHFGILDKKIVDQVNIINSIDAKESEGDLTSEEVSSRRVATVHLWRFSMQKDSLLCQKSRLRWLWYGDCNSKLFHASINRRRLSNAILGLNIEGVWVDDPVHIKDFVRSSFHNRFSESHWNRPKLDGVDFNCISKAENNFLTARFEELEIKEAVWGCDGDKSPGPDGFNFAFIKNSWESFKGDIYSMVEDFFHTGSLAKGCNASIVVLVPKNECLQGLGEFRPISLVGCIYKIISKLLAGRLKKVLHLIISDSQSAFMKWRYIMDGVLIANEIIEQAKKSNADDCFIFKVNFEKAYDSVNWSFLLYMMERMGFCCRWRNWIKACLQSNSVSILVNGSPTTEFGMCRGLRQGDSIAPFLFIIVAEGLVV